LLLGIAYVAGMMAPLIPLALIYGRARNRVRDPKVTLRLGAHAKRIGIARLAGAVVFAGFGVLFVVLALTGNSQTAPGFQRTLGSWMRTVASYVDGVPNVVSLPILAVVIGAFVYAVVSRGGERSERQEGPRPAPGPAAGRVQEHP
jgi:hypothetical protein